MERYFWFSRSLRAAERGHSHNNNNLIGYGRFCMLLFLLSTRSSTLPPTLSFLRNHSYHIVYDILQSNTVNIPISASPTSPWLSPLRIGMGSYLQVVAPLENPKSLPEPNR